MTTSTTIKLPVEFDNLMESIFGAGATYTFWWYASVRKHDELGPAYSVGILTEEDGTSTAYALVDVNTLAKTIENIIENRLYGWQGVLHSALNDDFDAFSADTVIQTAVLGKALWA